jgi:hypothetical protein
MLLTVKLSRQRLETHHKIIQITVVPRGGFEPPTLGLEVLCSIQLSYQGTFGVLYVGFWPEHLIRQVR